MCRLFNEMEESCNFNVIWLHQNILRNSGQLYVKIKKTGMEGGWGGGGGGTSNALHV